MLSNISSTLEYKKQPSNTHPYTTVYCNPQGLYMYKYVHVHLYCTGLHTCIWASWGSILSCDTGKFNVHNACRQLPNILLHVRFRYIVIMCMHTMFIFQCTTRWVSFHSSTMFCSYRHISYSICWVKIAQINCWAIEKLKLALPSAPVIIHVHLQMYLIHSYSNSLYCPISHTIYANTHHVLTNLIVDFHKDIVWVHN